MRKTVATVFADMVDLVQRHIVASTADTGYTYKGKAVIQATPAGWSEVSFTLEDGTSVVLKRNANWEN